MASEPHRVTHPSPTYRVADPSVSAVERAFQLAKSGRCSALQDIRYCLKTEGYSGAQVTGMTLLKQLRMLMKVARDDVKSSSAELVG